MCIENKREPSTEPGGTPLLSWALWEVEKPRETEKVRKLCDMLSPGDVGGCCFHVYQNL